MIKSIGVVALSNIAYWATLAIGYGSSMLLLSPYYNMTDGKMYGYTGDDCTVTTCELCYLSTITGFFGGCFVMGLLIVILMLSLAFMIWKLFQCFKYIILACGENAGFEESIIIPSVKTCLGYLANSCEHCCCNPLMEKFEKFSNDLSRDSSGKLIVEDITSSDGFEAVYNPHTSFLEFDSDVFDPYSIVANDKFEAYISYKESLYG